MQFATANSLVIYVAYNPASGFLLWAIKQAVDPSTHQYGWDTNRACESPLFTFANHTNAWVPATD